MYEAKIESMALHAMDRELNVEKKPGLVCPSDNGSHEDMDYALMRKGIRSLKGYFSQAFIIGFFSYTDGDFPRLRQWGRAYERKLLRTTHGVNTHLGSLFQLGILSYAMGRIKGRGHLITRETLEKTLAKDPSLQLLKKEGVFGARKEVLSGFHLSFESLRIHPKDRLYFILSHCEDQNILRRGGNNILATMQKKAKEAIHPTTPWKIRQEKREELRQWMKGHHISPGGAADVLINSFFLEEVLSFEGIMERDFPALLMKRKEEMFQKILRWTEEQELLLVLNLVFPGWVKDGMIGRSQMHHLMETMPLRFLEKRWDEAGLYAIATPLEREKGAEPWKRWAMELEKEHPLLDIDIYEKGIPLDRAHYGLEQRPCIVCGLRPAKESDH